MESMNGRRPKRHPGGSRKTVAHPPCSPPRAGECKEGESAFERPFVTVDVAILALRPSPLLGARASRPHYWHERENAGETPAFPGREDQGGLAVLLMKRGTE